MPRWHASNFTGRCCTADLLQQLDTHALLNLIHMTCRLHTVMLVVISRCKLCMIDTFDNKKLTAARGWQQCQHCKVWAYLLLILQHFCFLLPETLHFSDRHTRKVASRVKHGCDVVQLQGSLVGSVLRQQAHDYSTWSKQQQQQLYFAIIHCLHMTLRCLTKVHQ